MIPFFVLSATDQELTPEKRLARSLGIPPVPVQPLTGEQSVGQLLACTNNKLVGFIMDPEFWYDHHCWQRWLAAVEAAGESDGIYVPAGNQDSEWQLPAPLYLSISGLEEARNWQHSAEWLTRNATRATALAVFIAGRESLAELPASMMVRDLSRYWAAKKQTIHLFCHGWLHHFNALGDAGSRTDLLSMCDWGGSRVLELGCGTGQMAACCRQMGFSGLWVGIDYDRTSLAEARQHLDVVICADLNAGIPINAGQRFSFDRVVCGDVLEHLVCPEKTLTEICHLVSANAQLIASFPNVGHWSVIADLLAGRWDEAPSGIQCVTHLRFGTRRTWQRLLTVSGWRPLTWQREIVPLPQDWQPPANNSGYDPESLETVRYRVQAIPDNKKIQD